MIAAAKARREKTQRRATEALRRLDAQGEQVSFAALARAAGVSRAWLYRDPTLRVDIERVRAAQASSPRSRIPTRQRASDASLREMLAAVQAVASSLREENRTLRDALARTLGERRSPRRLRDSEESRR